MMFQFPDPIKFFFEEFPDALGSTMEELRALGSLFGIILIIVGIPMLLFARRLKTYNAIGILGIGFVLCCICGFDFGFRYFGYI